MTAALLPVAVAGTVGHPGDALAAVDLAGLAVVIEQIGEAAAQGGAVDDEIDHAVIEEELGGLEAVGQFLLGDLLDDARSGEADEGAGLGHDDIGDGGVAGGDAAVAGIDQQGDVRHARFAQPGEGGDGFGHLHEGEESLVHAGAAGGVDAQQRHAGLGGALDRAGELFPEDGTHAGAHEAEVGDGDGDGAAFDGCRCR